MHFCFYSLFSIFFTFCGYLLFQIGKNAPKTGYWISAFEKIIQSVFFFSNKIRSLDVNIQNEGSEFKKFTFYEWILFQDSFFFVFFLLILSDYIRWILKLSKRVNGCIKLKNTPSDFHNLNSISTKYYTPQAVILFRSLNIYLKLFRCE